MDNLNVSGIYKIRNSINGKFYIGSAVNILKRWNLHLHYLRRGEHHSQHFQRAFVKYGEAAFQLEVIETTLPTRSVLLAREQFYLDAFGPFKNFGYNVCPKAGSRLGLKHSASTKKKMSEVFRGRTPWNKGKKRPPFSDKWKKKHGQTRRI